MPETATFSNVTPEASGVFGLEDDVLEVVDVVVLEESDVLLVLLSLVLLGAPVAS